MAEGKPVSTLHLDLFCPTAANRLLEEGLLEDLCVHTCEVYNRAARLTQCFHCQAYGHVARACKNMTKCAHCAGEHSTQDCRRADNHTKVRCANCRQQGHVAWMKACPVRSAELDQLQVVWMHTPAWFQVGGTPQRGSTGGTTPTHPQRNAPPSHIPGHSSTTPKSILKRTHTDRTTGADATSSGGSGDEAGEPH